MQTIYTRYRTRLSSSSSSSDWLVSIIFLVTGLFILLLVPWIVRPGPDHDTVVLLVQILGGAFILLGVVILLWILGGLYFSSYFPQYTEPWTYYGRVIGASVAAALFAIPATLTFPFLLLAYAVRPNIIFGVDTDPLVWFLVGFLITAIGAACLWLTFAVVTSSYTERVAVITRRTRTTRV